MAYIFILAPNASTLATALTSLGHQTEASTTLREAYSKQLDINLAEEKGVELYIMAPQVPLGGPERLSDRLNEVGPDWMDNMTRGHSWWHKFGIFGGLIKLSPPPVLATPGWESRSPVHIVPHLEPATVLHKVQELFPS